MNRRALLKSIAVLTGGVITGADFLFNNKLYAADTLAKVVTDSNVILMNEIGETILPTTAKSKGAKAAAVGTLIKVIVADCYTEQEQKKFYEGIKKFNTDCLKNTGKAFLKSTKAERHNFLTMLDQKTVPNDYFKNFKQIILWAYFNSETGATEALRYISVPGRYEGCIPYTKGDRSWY